MGNSTNRNSILALIALAGVGAFFLWKPSSSGIAEEMVIDAEGKITYEGRGFVTEWSDELTEARGHLRMKERFYDSNIPIITWTYVITTGEFSDPEFVDLTSHKGGYLRWQAPRQPKGTLVSYHLIPGNPKVAGALKAVKQGDEVFIEGKLSTTGRITGDNGPLAQITSSSQKFLLVEAAGILE